MRTVPRGGETFGAWKNFSDYSKGANKRNDALARLAVETLAVASNVAGAQAHARRVRGGVKLTDLANEPAYVGDHLIGKKFTATFTRYHPAEVALW